MNCKNCGSPVDNNMTFCPGCGAKVQTQNITYCQACGTKIMGNDSFCPGCGAPCRTEGSGREQYRPAHRQGSGNMLVAVIIALISIIVIFVSVFFIVRAVQSNDKVEDRPVMSNEYVDEVNNLNMAINSFLDANAAQNNVGVAVIDNLTGAMYSSRYSDVSYTAWGLYLPVYLAYGQTGSYYGNVREQIMSSDPGTCNAAANTAIRDMGGLASVNHILSHNFGAANTTYGRFFGDTASASDNYTTANDAAVFLRTLDNTGEYTKLSYNIAGFGITAPVGANVYAQAGTENRNVRKDLNLFAIVKGQRSNYCVAILTRNSSGGYISQLLQIIHSEMENK